MQDNEKRLVHLPNGSAVAGHAAATISEEYDAAEAVKGMLDSLSLTWDKKAAVAMVAAVLILADVPNIKAKRGKVINTATEEFRRRLQAYLPL